MYLWRMPSEPQQLTKEQSAFFDTVRGGGCLYVVGAHSFQVFGLPYPSPFQELGVGIVGLFFVLSGFLIHRALLRHDARAFVRSRAHRVLPPFAAAIALTVALWVIAPIFFSTGSRDFSNATTRSGLDLAGLPSTLFLVNGLVGGTLSANGPLWNLALDVWLYVVAALCAAGGRWRWAGWAFLALICLRAPAYIPYMLAWASGWGWSVLHLQGRASVPTWKFAPFQWAAPFSYAIYITHFPMLLFLFGALGEQPWAAPLAYVLVVALAAKFGPTLERSGPAALKWWNGEFRPSQAKA